MSYLDQIWKLYELMKETRMWMVIAESFVASTDPFSKRPSVDDILDLPLCILTFSLNQKINLL